MRYPSKCVAHHFDVHTSPPIPRNSLTHTCTFIEVCFWDLLKPKNQLFVALYFCHLCHHKKREREREREKVKGEGRGMNRA